MLSILNGDMELQGGQKVATDNIESDDVFVFFRDKEQLLKVLKNKSVILIKVCSAFQFKTC